MKTHLTRWNPFKELDDLQERFAAALGYRPARPANREEELTLADWSPRVDIIEDEKEFLIKTELPEMKKEDVKVAVEDGVLTISGERKLDREEKSRKFHRIEREYGSFERRFSLPQGTSGEKVSADFKDGVLQVHLAKDSRTPGSKTVEIKAA